MTETNNPTSEMAHGLNHRNLRGQIPPILTGLVLIAAAALKSIDLFNGIVTQHLFWHLVEILLEAAVGLWLVSGRTGRLAALVTVCLFTVFTGVSATRGVTGHTSCGCFGPVRVNPWLTTILDLTIVLIMLWSMGGGKEGLSQAVRPHSLRRVLALLLAVAMIWFGVWGRQYWRPAFLHANGEITGGHGLLFTTPPEWYGRPMPVSRYIVGGHMLDKGQWLVIIYYHGCPVCQQAIASLARHYRAQKPANIRIALLQLPPWGHLPAGLAPKSWVRLKLSNQLTWRINPGIPSLVNLHAGRVTRVRVYAPGTFSGF